MANLMPIIFIAILYGVWKVLDGMQLPNTISIILVALVVICGAFFAFYKFSADPRRKAKIAREEKRLGRALTDEEMTEIQPRSVVGEFFASLFGVLFFVTVLRSFLFEPFQIPSGSMEPTLRVGDFLIVEKYAYGVKDPIWQNTLIETGKPQRGDVVVFKAPLEPHVDYIKRVVGIGGDRVIYNDLTHELTLIHNKNGEVCLSDCVVKAFKYTSPIQDIGHYVPIGQERDGTLVYSNQVFLSAIEKGSVEHLVYFDPPQLYNPRKNMVFYSGYIKQSEYMTEWVVPKDEYFMMGDSRDHSSDGRFWGFVPEKNIVGKARFIWLSLDKRQGEFPTGLRFERMFTSIK
ncbi:signal peptidase I [Ursidibacter arcticus]